MSETEYNTASLIVKMLYQLGPCNVYLILFYLQAIHNLLFTQSGVCSLYVILRAFAPLITFPCGGGNALAARQSLTSSFLLFYRNS